MIDSYTLSEKEIKSILNRIDREHHLQAYKTLKALTFSPKTNKKDVEDFKEKVIKLFKKENLPRLLTEAELDEIVSVIPLTPSTLKDIAEDNRRQIKNVIRRQLSKFKIVVNDKTIETIKKDIENKFYKSSSQAGDSVGVIASMSIGQPLTQANLNTFHNTGSKNSSDEGLKFVERLLNLSATKNPDKPTQNIIHFKDKNKTREEIYDIGKKIKGITIEDLIKPNEKKILEKLPSEDKYWYANYIKIMKINPNILKSNFFLRIKIDTNKLYKYDLVINDVVKVIKRTCRVAGFRETVECISSNSYLGIIDIYTSEEFARKKIQDYTQKLSKNSNLAIADINEQIKIFLKNILANSFKTMYLKGIKGIKNFKISEPLNISSTFNEISIINARDLDKFSSAPYNLKLEDINYLWYVRITKYFIFFVGLNEDKYIKLFQEAGMKIIENNFYDENPHFIVLLPKERNAKYFDEKTKKSYQRYTFKDGRYYDNKEEEWSKSYSPKKLIEEQLSYMREKQLYRIEEKLENNIIKDVNLYFEPLYRYAYYYHIIADGDEIISDLYGIKQIDFSFSYPDSTHHINKIFGIEAARFNLSSKYNSGNDMKNINPMNIELLIDFQTSYGYPLSVTAPTLAKQGNSILTSASFQNSLEYIFKGSAFGEVEQIKGISSCIITGSKSKNGTGIVESEFSKDYLNEENNKLSETFEEDNDLLMETNLIKGSCYKTSQLDNILDETHIEVKVSEEKTLDPPRTFGNTKEIEDILDIDIEYSQDDETKEKDLDDFVFDLDIPDAPEPYEGDLL